MQENVRFDARGGMVYAAISNDGCTDLHAIRKGELICRRYRDEILRSFIVPYAETVLDNVMLMDDNCRPYHADFVDDLF